jgi:hypothetical protein
MDKGQKRTSGTVELIYPVEVCALIDLANRHSGDLQKKLIWAIIKSRPWWTSG